MPIDLYQKPGSPPCQVLKMLGKVVGVKYNEILVDLTAGDQFKPDFIKLNPQHVIPTFVDDGFVLWESRAIMIYLMDQYAENSPLYPKDSKKRALIHQRLMFDQGTLYSGIIAWWMDMLMKKPITEDHFKRIDTAFEFLEKFLENSEYAAGDFLSLADFTLFVSVLSAEVTGHAIKPQFVNIKRWLDHLKKTIPGREVTDVEMVALKKWVDSIRN